MIRGTVLEFHRTTTKEMASEFKVHKMDLKNVGTWKG